jgi:hypothetical protein
MSNPFQISRVKIETLRNSQKIKNKKNVMLNLGLMKVRLDSASNSFLSSEVLKRVQDDT